MKLELKILAAGFLSISAFCFPASAQDVEPTLPFQEKLVGALFNQKVQAELELVDEQKSELKQILATLRQRQQTLGGELAEFRDGGASQPELLAKRDDLIQEFEKDKLATLDSAMKVLLPHQRKRLQQTSVQVMMRETARSKRIPTGVLVPEIRAYLEIDDAQASRIKNKAAELQKRLAEKIKKLTAEAQAELMQELSPEQKSKYDDLVGDPLDL